MKEDVLEQVVEDFLQQRGYFTRHNLRFKPSPSHPDYVGNQDSVASDIDVVGLHPTRTGPDRVWVVSCKSWQSGFNAAGKLQELDGTKSNPKGKPTWKHFREIWEPKWVEAFRGAVREATGQVDFHYSIAIARLTGPLDEEAAGEAWRRHPRISQQLDGCAFSFLTMDRMWTEILDRVTTTPASSEIGRLAQLLKAIQA